MGPPEGNHVSGMVPCEGLGTSSICSLRPEPRVKDHHLFELLDSNTHLHQEEACKAAKETHEGSLDGFVVVVLS